MSIPQDETSLVQLAPGFGAGLNRPLRIALTADPELPVPPRLYGGIERMIDMLATGLERRGHLVTLFAHRSSATAGELVAWPGKISGSPVDSARNALTLARRVTTRNFDLIHSFSRIAYLTPLLPLALPKLMTYQRPITPRTVGLAHRLSRGTLAFSAISQWMMREIQGIGQWTMIPNGVSLSAYTFQARPGPDAPLVFLGRVEEIKGPHLAIQMARQTGTPLIIAGNLPEEHRAWFDAEIAPHIDDRQIRYIGPIDDGAKNKLLGAARALVMPVLWDEPFGIVMAEAMACGTPVLGLGRGAVPEVIEDGVTGFVRQALASLIETVDRIGEIDRAECRQRVERHYSADVIVDAYLQLYYRLIGPLHAQPDGAL